MFIADQIEDCMFADAANECGEIDAPRSKRSLAWMRRMRNLAFFLTH